MDRRRPRTSVAAALIVALALVASGCGGGGGAAGHGSSAGSGAQPAGDAGSSGGAEAAELPDLPEPTAAQPCDGEAVLCVDAGSGGGEGSADAPFPTIGEAIEAAGSGATIQVAAGTYVEAVSISGAQDLSLVGGFAAGGDFSDRDPEADETTVQGADDASVVTVESSSGVLVEGLHLTGGGGFDDGYTRAGGGVYVDAASSDVAIVANRIDANSANQGDDPLYDVGGGIASSGTGVTIAGNVVEDNAMGRGAIAVGGEATVDQNTVTGNQGAGDHGGGIYASGDVTITGNRVEGNEIGIETGYGWGGGIIVYGDDTTALLQGNVVTGNSAPSAGSGVFVDDGADATLVGELYYANECTSEGGAGLFADSGGETETVIEASFLTVAQHDCPDSPSGGNGYLATLSEQGTPVATTTITDSIFWGNAALDVASLGGEVEISTSIAEAPIEGDGITADGIVEDDPLFADPAGGDFSLEDGSPAIGAGAGGRDLGSTGAG